MRVLKGVCMAGKWLCGDTYLKDGRKVPDEVKGVNILTVEHKKKMIELFGDWCRRPCSKCPDFANFRRLKAWADKDDTGWHKLALKLYKEHFF